jgi:type I restriction enzyme, S subunit
MADQTKKMVPPIRFKGFVEEWDEKPIGEVLTDKKRPIELEDNEVYELVTVRRRNGGVVSRGYLQGKDILVKNYSQLRAGDFIISKRQVVHGATGIVPQHLDKAIVSNEYMVAVGNEKISSEFLTILSTLPDMYRKFFLSSYGVDIEKLFFDADDWKKRNIVIPMLPEQSEICSYFEELDQIIGLHQQKHEKLVTLKKAMLKKMFPQNGATTPEIRFKGFFEPWEEKKIGEIMINISNNTLSRAELNYRSGLARNVHYGDVLIKFGEILNVNRDEIPFISNSDLANKLKPSILQDGDIIIADAAEDESVGKCTELINVGDEIVLAGLHTIALRPIVFFAPMYLGYFMNSPTYHDQFLRIIQGTKVLSISKSAIKCTSIFLPKDEAEQQKVGAYFRQIDKLIAQHGTQIEKLRQIKTACLEKMFV